MFTRKLALTGSALALFVVAGCGGDDKDFAATPSAPATTEAAASEPAPTGTKVKVAYSDYGRILFDGSKRAIYLFEADKTTRSECYGDCAEEWPPVLSEGAPAPGPGVDAAKLGTTERKDGTVQVTYAGNPLYYWHGDPPGEVYCQNVDEFGGLWLVVQASGEPVKSG